MPQRLADLTAWLKNHLKTDDIRLTPIVGDASFRRYFRLMQHGRPLIAVDAPPASEDSRSFVAIAKVFAARNIAVPTVFAADLDQGFLLLSDLGDQLYFKSLRAENAEQLYGQALLTLQEIQSVQPHTQWQPPAFDQAFILQELQFFQQWFLEKYLQVNVSEKILHKVFALLINSAVEQPQVCVHRDYHSRNLMLLDDGRVGVLDFQDAVWGPVTYDAVSLLRDCYIAWPHADVQRWALNFHQQSTALAPYSAEQFIRWFDLMGMQRHLKAIFIFARKYLRDGVSHYLADIPRTLTYVLAVSREYPELADFHSVLTEHVAPRILR